MIAGSIVAGAPIKWIEDRSKHLMSTGFARDYVMRAEMCSKDGATAIQDDPERPVFHGNGPYDSVCVECGNVLAAAMDPQHMTKRVRVRCGRWRTVNVAVFDALGET